MGKKLFTLFLSFVLIISTFVYPVIANDESDNENGEVELGLGGLDFYSITIHYDSPTVVDYKYISRNESQKDDLIYYYNQRGTKVYKDGYIFGEPTDKFVLRTGDSRDTGYTMYKDRVQGNVMNFNGVESVDYPNHALYSRFPYRYAYITHIQNDTTIMSKRGIFFHGLTRVSDDAGQINPNFIVRDDGYIQTADGELKIDINGYLLYEGDIWKDIDGNIIELFEYNDEGELVLANKYDENGRIRFLRPSDPVFLYRVEDKNGDGTYDESEIITNALGHKLFGEPINGIPARTNKITKITIELDALGTQIYSDVSQDPQQQNEIIITLDDWYEQILADNHNAKKDKNGNIIKPEEIKGKILTTVKSVTTKTEVNLTDKDKEPTYKSIELDLTEEELHALPNQAYVFLTFKIKEHQPEATFTEKQSEEMVNIWRDKPEYNEIEEEGPDWIMIAAIGGGALVVVAIVVIVIAVAVSKKNKNKATNTNNTEVEIEPKAEE